MEQEGKSWDGAKLEWVRYEQSSSVRELGESSVSYAAGLLSVGRAS